MTATMAALIVHIGEGCEYEWLMPIEEALSLTGPDEDYHDGGDEVRYALDNKRADYGYVKLRENIRQNGMETPVLVYDDTIENGYHRVAVAVDLGWTHVPVTGDYEVGWSGTEWAR